jgi:hypothetical protein
MPTSVAQAANSATVMQVDPPQGPNPQSLAELEARLARDLELLLIPPAKEWLQPTAHPRRGLGCSMSPSSAQAWGDWRWPSP